MAAAMSSDVKRVSAFRANSEQLIEQVKATGRPLVLTQRGHSSAVVLDVAQYERMVEQIEIVSDVRTAMQQLVAGERVSHRSAKVELRRRFTK